MEASGEVSVGVIARNEDGQVVFSAWRYFDKCGSAAEVEALACVEGLQRAVHWGVTPIVVETDCARIVSALRSL